MSQSGLINLTSGEQETALVYFESAVVDFTQAQLVTLMTTDAAQYFIPLGLSSKCLTFNTVTARQISGNFGFTPASYNDYGSVIITLNALYNFFTYDQFVIDQSKPMVPPSTALIFDLTGPDTATSYTGKIIVYGFFA